MKGQHFAPAFDHYLKQIKAKITIIEIDAKSTPDEHKRIMEHISPKACIIVMDERGKNLSSREWAQKINDFQISGRGYLQFIIGGADGLNEDIRNKADLILSFGMQTWPHMLLRVMWAEQIYRALQILAGHPYHRD